MDKVTTTVFVRQPTAQGLLWGEPAIEKEGTAGRRMCFSHAFSPAEIAGARRISDILWAQKRIEAVAVKENIATALDTSIALTAKVEAITKVSAKMPVDWKPPTTVAKVIDEKPVGEVKVIK